MSRTDPDQKRFRNANEREAHYRRLASAERSERRAIEPKLTLVKRITGDWFTATKAYIPASWTGSNFD